MKKIIALCTVIGLAGCNAIYTTDPYTGEQKVRDSIKYGAIGAASCGAASLIINKDEDTKAKRTRNSALGCAAVGAGVGHYMDMQEQKLRAMLVNSGVQVMREGDNLRLIMPSNITFAINSSQLNSNFHNTLAGVARILKEFNKTQIRVVGHTDNTGSDKLNQPLSEERASVVADFLVSQSVSIDRIRRFGMGDRQPIASNSTAAGRQQNRRVELKLVPPESI